MKNLIIFFIVVINFIAFSQSDKVNFYSKTSKVKTIKLTEKILIGDINTLDVDKKGNILITDRIASQVCLFSNDGRLLKALSPDSCYPGFNWRPFNARFDKKGNILVLNSIPWGYRFDGDGLCLGEMNITFTAPPHISFFSDGSLVGYYNLGRENHLKMMDKTGKEKFRFGKFPKEYEKLIYRFEGGGVVTDQDDNVYQLNVSSPEIFKYSSNGNFIKSFMHVPSYYRKIERDLSGYDPAKALTEVPKLLKDKTIALSLFLFDTNKLMVQLYNGKFYGIQICDLEGNYMLKDEIILDRPILNAKFGLIYLIHQPEPDKAGNLPNPVIEVYKLQ